MKSRRSLIVISGVLLVLLVAAASLLYALPTIARHVAIARLQAITKRPVAIDRVEVRPLAGRLTIHGLRVAEPDGGGPFAALETLDVRLHLVSLARGHIWVRELVLVKPTLRIVRLEKRFNFSDLFQGSETTRSDSTSPSIGSRSSTGQSPSRTARYPSSARGRPTTSRSRRTTCRPSRTRARLSPAR